ncbi:hypothetical protein ABID59_005465 [Bradyrhizobium sp. S3.3.6]|uniref:hypothetical protein n=1 Tax=Bradyrhizobium sp. S3.3.6 TaxID=3156429 RepID=UPI0033984FEF
MALARDMMGLFGQLRRRLPLLPVADKVNAPDIQHGSLPGTLGHCGNIGDFTIQDQYVSAAIQAAIDERIPVVLYLDP